MRPLTRRHETIALAAIILLASALRLWGLDQNGWGAEYYTAAVRSMALNWHNFLYNAFDPSGFISVDKPPVALWPQVLGVKLFGFHPMSVLLPQVIEGVASVWLLFHLVRPRFGARAALLASLFFAITPVWVAVNRTNNMDSCLLFVLLMAAWPLMKAAEQGSRRLLLLSAALVGIAFNVKMLAAFIVLPAFYLVYLAGALSDWRRRLCDLALATAVLAMTSLPWIAMVEITPAESRPFVGSSSNNSMLELILGHNAARRFLAPATQSAAQPATHRSADPDAEQDHGATPRTLNIASRLFVRTPPGPLRLFHGQLAAQAGWLFPFAAIALAFAVCRRGWRQPLSARGLALLFWSSWLLTYGIVYSALGGIIHYYYLSTMAPALAALAGIGVAALWDGWQKRSRALLLPAMLLATAAWQAHVHVSAMGRPLAVFTERMGEWQGRLALALIAVTLIAAAGLIMLHVRPVSDRIRSACGAALLASGILALLVLPLAWALSSILAPGHGVVPLADFYRLEGATRRERAYMLAGFRQAPDTSRLVGFLEANRKGERYLLSTSTTQFAAPIIIRTGEAVMARGGFHGLDPAVSPEALARMVEAKQVRFAMLGDVAAVSRRMGASAAGKPVAVWIREHGRPVDPALWKSPGMRRDIALYDLRPETGLVPAP